MIISSQLKKYFTSYAKDVLGNMGTKSEENLFPPFLTAAFLGFFVFVLCHSLHLHVCQLQLQIMDPIAQQV